MPPPRVAVALVPAVGFAAGCALAPQMAFAPVPLVAALAAAGVARGRALGGLIACLALGLLRAGVEPWPLERGGFRSERAVSAVVRVVGAWTGGAASSASSTSRGANDSGGPTARGQLLALRQGLAVGPARQPIWLDWSAQSTLPEPGTVLRVRGHLARSQAFANRVVVPAGSPRLKIKSALLTETLVAPRWIDRLAKRLRVEADGVWPPSAARPGVVLARALLVGDTTGLPAAWRRGFRRSGLAHLLAVSGFNVSLLAGATLLVAAPLPRPLRFALTASLVVLYWLLVGPQAPIARATHMAILAGVALLCARPPSACHALSLAAILALIGEPGAVSDLSFQLTFAATAGLVLVAPALANRWSALPRPTALALAVPISAHWVTLPWAIERFHQTQILSAVYNVVAVPWAAAAMLVVVATTAMGVAVPATIPLARAAMDWMARPVDLLSSPGFHLGVVPIRGLSAGLVTLVAIGMAASWWPRRFGRIALAAVPLLLVGRSLAPLFGPAAPEPPSWTALDVGQGDATLLRGGGVSILVDGGGYAGSDFAGRVLVPALAGEGVAAIDVAVVSHRDLDHCGGLADLADYMPIGEVWSGPGWEAADCTRRLMTEIGARSAVLVAGDVRRRGPWRFEVLAPALLDFTPEGASNDQSLVLRAEAAGRTLILSGDLEERGELELVARARRALKADWLKLGHHGSATSSIGPFLRAVSPRLAWISAGRRNAFGHPAPPVIDRLRELGLPFRRTDRDGLIHVRWEAGGSWRLELPSSPAMDR